MRQFTVYAPAKLNLYLDVLDKRPDGYHNIETLFEKIDLKDEIIICEKGSTVRINVEPSKACPAGRDNIAYKAIQSLLEEAKVNLGLEIIIKKNIPVSAGLGGGSSDAASLLRSINETFELGIGFERLFSIASEIGKDVPFFMLDATFAKGTGTGDMLEPLDVDFSLAHIIIKPDTKLSTAEMYKRLDSYSRSRKANDMEKTISGLRKKDLTLLRENCYNIFEEVLGDKKGHIEKAKGFLNDVGAGPCFLSGSGSAVFSILNEGEEAIEIFKRMPKEKGLKAFLATSCKS